METIKEFYEKYSDDMFVGNQEVIKLMSDYLNDVVKEKGYFTANDVKEAMKITNPPETGWAYDEPLP